MPTVPIEGKVEDEGNGVARLELNPVERKQTQADQDQEDDVARRKAMKELVQSWMDRLQLISVITTFFASTEAGLLQVIIRDDPAEFTATESAANAGVLGALVLHTNAAILSFLASFLLVRYRVEEAKKEEMKIEYAASDHDRSDAGSEHPDAHSIHADLEKGHAELEKGHAELEERLSESDNRNLRPPTASAINPTLTIPKTPLDRPPLRVTSPSPLSPAQSHAISNTSFSTPLAGLSRQTFSEPPIFHADPHLETVGPFAMLQPPTHLLSRCHALCIWLSALGFVLAIMGIGCFAWSRQTSGVAIFTSVLIGGSATATGLVFLYPGAG